MATVYYGELTGTETVADLLQQLHKRWNARIKQQRYNNEINSSDRQVALQALGRPDGRLSGQAALKRVIQTFHEIPMTFHMTIC